MVGKLLTFFPQIIATLFAFRFSYSGFFIIFEYLGFSIFKDFTVKNQSEVDIFFLNSIAHVQHYYWKKDWKKDPRFKWSFYWVDQILCEIYQLKPKMFVTLNSLSQKSTEKEEPWILYIPRNLAGLLQKLGIPSVRVESLMSYDATLIFNDSNSLHQSKKILDNIQVNGQPLFKTQITSEEKHRLFMRVDFFNPISAETKFVSNGKEFNFSENFETVVQRTAKHDPIGSVISNFELPTPAPYNHELFQVFTEKISRDQEF